MMDEIAVAAGGDPIEIRLDLIKDAPNRQVLKTVAQMADWGAYPGGERARDVAVALVLGAPTAQIMEIEQAPVGIKLVQVWVAAEFWIALNPRNLDAQLICGMNVWD